MLTGRQRFFYSIAVATIGCFLLYSTPAFATTFTVNSPTDEASDGACTTPYTDSANDCTLRDAIALANSTGGADTINFGIDTSFQSNPSYYDNGQYTITVASVLASLSGQTTLSAASVWDTANDRPGIKIYYTGTAFDGFTFDSGSSNSQIAGLEIVGFSKAISITTNTVTVGTDCNGTTDARERNVLHGNVYGVYITRASSIVAGNYIGTASDGVTFANETLGDIWINGIAADGNTIGFREGTTGSCSPTLQRNILAGTTGTGSSLIYIFGTGTLVTGDVATGANNNYVSGNYIGTDVTGTVDLSGKIQNPSTGNVGVRLSHAAIYNWIGTDGDGIDDEYEGNVINAATTGITTVAVSTNYTGTNRIAGNKIGVQPDGVTVIGTSMLLGAIIHGGGNIVGWCDTSDNATLCSNTGSVENQRNIFGGASTDQFRFGAIASGSYIYGNYIGVGADGSTDVSTANGIFIHRASHDNVVGGTGNRANTIKFNTIGVKPDGDFTGARGTGASQSPITNTFITNNTISNNDTAGIQLYWTENFGASSITVNNNTITNNGTYGIDIFGSSPTVTGNTIQDNTGYGVYIHPGFIKRNAGGTWHPNEATTSYNPDDAATNILAAPTITGNTISNNGDSEMYQFDSRAANYATLFIDNTISNNTNNPAITQAWYGAVEILDQNENVLTADLWSSVAASVIPYANSGDTQTSQAAVAVDASDMIVGPTAVSYDDVTTWFPITDYTIDTNGTTTSYNPYTITVNGEVANTPGDAFTFDGSDNDVTYSGILPNGITTSGLYRFQIAKVATSSVPSTPTNISPADAATSVSVTPALVASSFIDSNESHSSSTWQIYSGSSLCSAGGTGDVYSLTSSTQYTTLSVPGGILDQETTYYWRVKYTNSYGNSSSYSSCTSFTTKRTTPYFTGALADVSWNEDESVNDAFDLDDYFSDPDGESITYSIVNVDNSLTDIQVTIDDANAIDFSSTENWFGEATVQFTGCDINSECISSNEVHLIVASVNDTPIAPADGFSPASGDTTTSTTPTISWNAGSDEENGPNELSYQLYLSTTDTPDTQAEQELSSTVGETQITIDDALQDETTYYYVVRTLDSDGGISSWSDIQSFTVNTSVDPNITLTKSVSVISSDLSSTAIKTAASLTGASTGTIKKTITTSFAVSLLLLVISAASILIRYKHPNHSIQVALGQPALAFADIVSQNKKGTYTESYSQFRRIAIPLGRAFQASAMLVGLFLVFNIVSYADFVSQSDQIAPGDTLRVTLTYQNTGDGAATSVTLEDAIPSKANYIADSASITDNEETVIPNNAFSGHTLSYAIGTIPSDSSGLITYDVILDNPISSEHVNFSAAEIAANEFNEPITSNAVRFSVTGAQAVVTVQSTNGEPLSDIDLTWYEGSAADGQEVFTRTTDENGELAVEGLRSGTYTITADTGEEYRPADAQSIDLSYSETAHLIITLEPIPPADPNTNPDTDPEPPTNTNTPTPDENINDNENTNENENSPEDPSDNENSGKNNNDNSNNNTNHNGNTNIPSDSDNPVDTNPDLSEEEKDFLKGLPPLTEKIIELTSTEKRILQNALDKGLSGALKNIQVTLDGQPTDAVERLEDITLITRPKSCGVRSTFMRFFKKEEETPLNTELLLEGDVDLPKIIQEKLEQNDAPVRIRITIFSQPTVQISEVQSDGTWHMEFPLELFTNTTHTAVAEISANGQSSGVVEITKFAVQEKPCVSRTILLFIANIVFFILFVSVLYIFFRKPKVK